MDQAVVNYPSVAEQRMELLTIQRLEVGRGDGFLMNCLSDYLLQCLVSYKIILRPAEESSD